MEIDKDGKALKPQGSAPRYSYTFEADIQSNYFNIYFEVVGEEVTKIELRRGDNTELVGDVMLAVLHDVCWYHHVNELEIDSVDGE